MFIKIQTGGGTATFYKSVKRSNAIARKAKNGSSIHGEPFFFWGAPPNLPKGEGKEKASPNLSKGEE
jgi:hypothetical protein